MEVCETSVSYAYSTNGLPREDEHRRRDEIQSSSLPNLAAILPAASVDAYGGERFPLSLADGISGAVQRFSSQLASIGERKSSSSYLADGTMCHSVCKSVRCRNSVPKSSSSDGLHFSDAMNQYLDDNNFGLTNDPPSKNGENGFVDVNNLQSSGDNHVVTVDVLPCCSRCHVNDGVVASTPNSCRYQDADDMESCYGDGNCIPDIAVPLLQDAAAPRNGMPSPEMDFLDFDFDPPPSGDEMQGGESDNSSNDDVTPNLIWEVNARHVANGMLAEPEQRSAGCSVNYKNSVSSPKYQNCLKSLNRTNGELCLHGADDAVSDNTDSDSVNMEACGERLLQRESSLFNIQGEEMECVEPTFQSVLLNSLSVKAQGEKSPNAIKNECLDETELSIAVEEPVEKVMIWSELAACNRQVTQIGTSACGATSIINALMALEVSFETGEVKKHILTRLRAESAPIATYLISRCSAGTTHEDLIDGVHRLTDGKIYGRFFHFYPSCTVNLAKWLGRWIKKGAVPVATLNLQCGIQAGQSIPDAWHHQMIFGVGPKGVYLTNPLECIPLSQIQKQLCSPSVLLVRRNDILNRWGEDCDLGPLMTHEDERWRSMNVVGQVINILRESTAPWIPGYRRHLTSHVKIPAAYKSGISIFVHKGSDVYKELIKSKEVT